MKSKFKDRWGISWKTFWNSASQPCHDCLRQHWVGSQVEWVLHWNSNWNPRYSPLQCGPAVVSTATGRRRNKLLIFFLLNISNILYFFWILGRVLRLEMTVKEFQHLCPSSICILRCWLCISLAWMWREVKGIGIVKEEEV